MAMPLLLLASGEPAPITAVAGEPVCELCIRLAEAMGVEAEFVELVAGEAVLEDEQTLDQLPQPVDHVQVLVNTAAAIKFFEDFNLKEPLLRGVLSYGFEKPSLMQRRVIPLLVEGHHTIVETQSGTGKTAAYVLAALQKADPEVMATQALVLAPTRELACPIQKVAAAIGNELRVNTHSLIGGNDMRTDIDKLRDGQHFVVGTPGRVSDHIRNRHLRLDYLKMFLLDEVDEMMSRGFKGLIFDTVEMLPQEVQLAVMTATIPPDLLEFLKMFLRHPVHIKFRRKELTLEGTRQFYVEIEKEEFKLDTLSDLLEVLTMPQMVIYCNTRRKLNFVSDQLDKRGFTSSSLHAELDHNERELILQEFRSGASRLLLSTDLLARGDSSIPAAVVVNFDLPANMENYLHRVGRAQRFGRKHVAINFVTNHDVRTMKDIEKYYHTQIEEMPMDIADLI